MVDIERLEKSVEQSISDLGEIIEIHQNAQSLLEKIKKLRTPDLKENVSVVSTSNGHLIDVEKKEKKKRAPRRSNANWTGIYAELPDLFTTRQLRALSGASAPSVTQKLTGLVRKKIVTRIKHGYYQKIAEATHSDMTPRNGS